MILELCIDGNKNDWIQEAFFSHAPLDTFSFAARSRELLDQPSWAFIADVW